MKKTRWRILDSHAVGPYYVTYQGVERAGLLVRFPGTSRSFTAVGCVLIRAKAVTDNQSLGVPISSKVD